MSLRAHDRTILVPVANPASATPLLRYAANLAGPGGRVHLVTVVAPDATTHEHGRAREGLAAAEALATDLGVTVHGQVRPSPSAGTGVLAAIDEDAPALVLLGWRGTTSASDVFGRLIDHVVGRSSIPLAVIRLGREPIDRIVIPVSAEHLLPGGGGSLSLAADLTRRIQVSTGHPTTVLRTGPRRGELPDAIRDLGDRTHHDPRRTHKAVEAFHRDRDLIVAPVAPTASGLRAATTHLAWAAPEATLLVAVDVGPVRSGGLADAVTDAGRPAPRRARPAVAQQRIVVTVRLPDGPAVNPDAVEALLATVGEVELVMSWWPADDDRAHVGATVTVTSEGPNRALAAVMTTLHDAPQLRGAEISYELEQRAPDRSHQPLETPALMPPATDTTADGTDRPHEVDARGLACPMPVIELARAIDEVAIGTRVLLLATDPAAKVDVPVWCRMQRHRLHQHDDQDGVTSFLVERLR